MSRTSAPNSNQKPISEKIQHYVNVVLALGAIATVITGAITWLRKEPIESQLTQQPITQPVPSNEDSINTLGEDVTTTAGNIENSINTLGGDITATGGNIDIENNSEYVVPKIIETIDIRQSFSPSSPAVEAIPIQKIQDVSDSPQENTYNIQDSPSLIADQRAQPTHPPSQSSSSTVTAPPSGVNASIDKSPGSAQVINSPGATATTSVTEHNAPVCAGGVGNACAPGSTANNDLRGSAIDNRSTTQQE